MGGLPRKQPEDAPRAVQLGTVPPGSLVAVGEQRALVLTRSTFISTPVWRVEVVWLADLVPIGREHLWSDVRVTVLPEKPPLTLWDPDAPRKNAEQERAVRAMIAANGGRE